MPGPSVWRRPEIQSAPAPCATSSIVGWGTPSGCWTTPSGAARSTPLDTTRSWPGATGGGSACPRSARASSRDAARAAPGLLVRRIDSSVAVVMLAPRSRITRTRRRARRTDRREGAGRAAILQRSFPQNGPGTSACFAARARHATTNDARRKRRSRLARATSRAPIEASLGSRGDSLAPPGSATRGRILARRNPQAPTAASPRGRGHRPRRAHAATATLRPRPGLDPRGKAAEARPSRGRGGVC